MDAYMLAKYPNWQLYVQSIDRQTVDNLYLKNENPLAFVRKSFLDLGCDGLRQIVAKAWFGQSVNAFFCEEDILPRQPQRTLCPFCPVTCNCPSGAYFRYQDPNEMKSGPRPPPPTR
eukprot:TRINITY_DN95558_c0_g1_i1.p1 TRINITY_DN95558_c0_g1~~TRINITY_DN95558_c0_g1_i1.p1  ORF type:complete len:117 (-),score=6.40 TRINITY_DN95558_c0_g1_i1:128-478(-)